MNSEHARKGNNNLATILPPPPHTGATVATTNVITICTPKRGATKDTGYTTPIGATRVFNAWVVSGKETRKG